MEHGKFEKAEASWRELLVLLEDEIGTDNPMIPQIALNISLCIGKQVQLRCAVDFYWDIYESRARLLGASHPQLKTMFMICRRIEMEALKRELALGMVRRAFVDLSSLIFAPPPMFFVFLLRGYCQGSKFWCRVLFSLHMKHTLLVRRWRWTNWMYIYASIFLFYVFGYEANITGTDGRLF